MRVVWTSPARRQLADATEYIATYDPLAALTLDEKVDQTIERLVQFPNSGRIGRIIGTREGVIGAYILVYEVHTDFLLVTHFVHGNRLFPPENR